MNKQAYEQLFEKDQNDAFIRLIIPANEPFESDQNKAELNLIGKSPTDYTLDEVVRMKQYASKLYEQIEDE